jgi:MoaA/NifB/PqqE/SkfB family radical SAM enzyme
MNDQSFDTAKSALLGKFEHPDITAKGEVRASVPLAGATTLWFNTGTLCNIECMNCYIESSPKNDNLVYITAAEVEGYLDQIVERDWPTTEIAFTGGEPFMNPEMIEITRVCLKRGYDVLILTNAMLPMMRKSVKAGLIALNEEFPNKLTLRVSLDHFKRE